MQELLEYSDRIEFGEILSHWTLSRGRLLLSRLARIRLARSRLSRSRSVTKIAIHSPANRGNENKGQCKTESGHGCLKPEDDAPVTIRDNDSAGARALMNNIS